MCRAVHRVEADGGEECGKPCVCRLRRASLYLCGAGYIWAGFDSVADTGSNDERHSLAELTAQHRERWRGICPSASPLHQSSYSHGSSLFIRPFPSSLLSLLRTTMAAPLLFCASHLSSIARLQALQDALRSWQRQSVKSTFWLSVSWESPIDSIVTTWLNSLSVDECVVSRHSGRLRQMQHIAHLAREASAVHDPASTWVCFMDDDDLLRPERLSAFQHLIENGMDVYKSLEFGDLFCPAVYIKSNNQSDPNQYWQYACLLDPLLYFLDRCPAVIRDCSYGDCFLRRFLHPCTQPAERNIWFASSSYDDASDFSYVYGDRFSDAQRASTNPDEARALRTPFQCVEWLLVSQIGVTCARVLPAKVLTEWATRYDLRAREERARRFSRSQYKLVRDTSAMVRAALASPTVYEWFETPSGEAWKRRLEDTVHGL